MANPTTNFNWQMPTNTDLVKDLPADFEVFGQAVDTSLADLKGGTSGQILSKNSNTDMDFVWINNDQGDITAVNVTSPITGGGSAGAVTVGIQDATTAQKGAVQLENSTSSTSTTTAAVPASVKSAYDLANAAIPKSLVDAAGDLIYATANDTVARLGIGTAGQVLQVNSGATAPEWATPATGGGMTLLNAGGTTLTGSSVTISSISGSYNALEGFIRVYRPNTDNTALQMRFNGVSTSNTYFNAEGAQIEGGPDAFNASSVTLSYGIDSGTQYSLFHFYIPDYANTTSWKYAEISSIAADGTTATSVTKLWGFGIHNQTAAITSLEFFSSSGTMTSGTLFLYGVK